MAMRSSLFNDMIGSHNIKMIFVSLNMFQSFHPFSWSNYWNYDI